MKDYTYSVARVRAMEASLLTANSIEQLIEAPDYETALGLIRDNRNNESLDDIADGKLGELVKLPIDYHNIKASVKSVFSDMPADELLLDGGVTDKNEIYSAVRESAYGKLPEVEAETAQRAMELLLHTQDGQLCDIYIDNAQLAAIEKTAKEIGDSFAVRYAKLIADTAKLKTAFRCALTSRTRSFTEKALYKGGSLDSEALAAAAANGKDALAEYIKETDYAESAEYIKRGAGIEKWCDDKVMSLMEEARYECFSAAPIIAYAYAVQTQRRMTEMILTAKKSRIDKKIIRERVRKLYA
jgi:V/A-type H+-transporting ATPase subunit C